MTFLCLICKSHINSEGCMTPSPRNFPLSLLLLTCTVCMRACLRACVRGGVYFSYYIPASVCIYYVCMFVMLLLDALHLMRQIFMGSTIPGRSIIFFEIHLTITLSSNNQITFVVITCSCSQHDAFFLQLFQVR